MWFALCFKTRMLLTQKWAVNAFSHWLGESQRGRLFNRRCPLTLQMRFWVLRPHGTIQWDKQMDGDQNEWEERRLHDQWKRWTFFGGEVLSPRQHKSSDWCVAASGEGESPTALFKLGVSKLANSCTHLNNWMVTDAGGIPGTLTD